MLKQLWKDAQKRKNAQELIEWLLSTKTAQGWPVDEINMIAYSELICSSLNPKLSRSVVIKVFDEMIKSGKKTVDEFETIYEQHLDMQNRSAPQNKTAWTFFVPLEITLNSDVVKPASIRVLGKDFTFLSKTEVESQLGKNLSEDLPSLGELTIRPIRPIPQVFLCVNDQGDSWEDVWNKVSPAFDTLRGLMEYCFNFNQWSFSSHQRPRRKVPHPLWFIFQKSRGSLDGRHFETEECDQGTSFDLNAVGFKQLQQIANILANEPEQSSQSQFFQTVYAFTLKQWMNDLDMLVS